MIPPLVLTVPLDWTDWNGHMNEARYLEAFSRASDAAMDRFGCGPSQAGVSFFTLETHLVHLGEVRAGETVTIETRLLSLEGRRLHLFHAMTRAGSEVAVCEQLALHVDLATRRGTDPAEALAAALRAACTATPPPRLVGRRIGDPRP